MPLPDAMPLRSWTACLTITLCGCTTSHAPPGTRPDAGEASDASEPGASLLALRTDPYLLGPGREEYRCWWFPADSDAGRGIRRMRNVSGPGIHHVALFWDSEGPAAPTACDDFGGSWTLMGGGGTTEAEVAFPPGTAMPLHDRGAWVVQLHLLNATRSPIEVVSGYDLELTAYGEPYSPVGIYLMGNTDFSVPPRTTDHVVEQTCSGDLPPGAELVMLFPHMHTLGTRFEAEVGSLDSMARVLDDPWRFDEQTPVPLSPSLRVAAGDALRVRCHYDNPGDDAVPFGQSTHDEMCFGVWFYHPAPAEPATCVR